VNVSNTVRDIFKTSTVFYIHVHLKWYIYIDLGLNVLLFQVSVINHC